MDERENSKAASNRTDFGNPFASCYRFDQFEFEGRTAYMVFPPAGKENGKWLLKTVYFGAFPALEMHLLDEGYHLAYVDGRGRFADRADIDLKARFIRFVAAEYGLEGKCVPVGMSAGGWTALKLAAYYPELVSVMYLDAACVNIFSCPLGFGNSVKIPEMIDEVYAYLGLDRISILAYRESPLDLLPQLVKAGIPAAIVYGKADKTVPYDENGKYVEDAYRKNGIPALVIGKEGCDHHPHGLDDDSKVIEFIREHS